MPPATVYSVGEYRGTAKNLAKIFLVSHTTMKGRLYRFGLGKIPLEKVLIYGNDIRGSGGFGTAEWAALKDSKNGRPENLTKIKVGKFDNIPARFDNDNRRFPLPDMLGFEISGD